MFGFEEDKKKIMEMHGILDKLLNAKQQEVLGVVDNTNRSVNLGHIRNRTKDVAAFLEAAKKVELGANFVPGFKEDFERCKAAIESIKI